MVSPGINDSASHPENIVSVSMNVVKPLESLSRGFVKKQKYKSKFIAAVVIN